MLVFVDQQKVVRVLRQNNDPSGKASRTAIGTINKVSLAKNLAKAVRLSAEENDEIESTLEVLRRSKSVKRQAYALEFPQIVREVIEYVEGGASRPERQLIATAVIEAARRIRKLEKTAA